MQSVTLYYPGTSFFHLCDCRVKLLLMLIFTVIAFLFYNPIVPAALFIAALLMNLSAIGTRTFKNFLFKMILVMMAFLLVLHGFANPNGSVPAQFWGHQLRIPFFGCYTVDGFYLGLVFWLRLSSIVLIAMLFVTTTSSAEIMRGLQKLGVPFRFCFMLTMSLQLIPITAREAGIIGSAQRARGLPEKNFIDKLKGLVPMFVPVVSGTGLRRIPAREIRASCLDMPAGRQKISCRCLSRWPTGWRGGWRPWDGTARCHGSGRTARRRSA